MMQAMTGKFHDDFVTAFFFDTDINCNKIQFKFSVKESRCYENIPKLTGHCQQQRKKKKMIKLILFILRHFYQNAGGITTSIFFDTDLKCNKIRFKVMVI